MTEEEVSKIIDEFSEVERQMLTGGVQCPARPVRLIYAWKKCVLLIENIVVFERPADATAWVPREPTVGATSAEMYQIMDIIKAATEIGRRAMKRHALTKAAALIAAIEKAARTLAEMEDVHPHASE